MALNFENENDFFEVISFKDESVTCDQESYGEYLKTLDETILQLKPDVMPTRFKMKKIIPYAVKKNLRKDQYGMDTEGKNINVNLGFIIDEVRASLVDINNPGKGLEFKKDGDNMASKLLIEKLDTYGIVQELYAARQGVLGAKGSVSKKS